MLFMQGDPAADQRDEHDDHGDREPLAGVRPGVIAREAGMDQDVGDDQQREREHDRQVAPVPAGDDFPPDDDARRGKKGEVGERGGKRAGPRRQDDRDAARQPEQGQRRQRSALQRQPPRPVRNGGQEETADRRTDEAEKEFVEMLGHRIESGGQFDRAPQHQDPDHHGEARPEAGCQKERTEVRG